MTSSQDRHLASAIASLRALLDDPDLPAELRRGLAPEFEEIEQMIERLQHGQLHVAVFGRVSVGKSALLNALIGSEQFKVGVLHGSTRERQLAHWGAVGASAVHLIDTPGINEIDGEERERLARHVAARADLIIFVVEGDMTASEVAALRQLADQQRPMLLVLNKADRYSQSERELLRERLIEHSAGCVRPEHVLLASALPAPITVLRIAADGSERESRETPPADVASLQAAVFEVLNQEGKTLAAVNAGLFAGQLSDELGRRLTELRRELGDKLIRNYALGKGIAVGLNPLPIADLVAAASLDIALVMHLGRVYGLPLTKMEAGELVLKIAAQIAALMGAIWGVNALASTLKGISLGLSTALTAGAQGALAYFSTYLTGRAAQRYLVNGKSWGELGPKRVVEDILAGLDRDSILRDARAEILAKLRS